MKKLALLVGAGLSVLTFAGGSAMPAGAATPQELCREAALVDGLPRRRARADMGSEVIERVRALGGTARDRVLADEVLAGNVPGFLRSLSPVTLSGQTADGRAVEVTICVTPDYLAVGDDRDYVRTPLGLPAAAEIADRLGFMLPTPRMVDAIYAQAGVHLAPKPMEPTREMSSTDYFWRHNGLVEAQRAEGGRAGTLTAGQKKDIVLTTRLRSARGRVAIYGWHRTNGRPIQPLSTVHGAEYADYSHGVRLVSSITFVNGQAVRLTELMADPALAPIVSSEGPIEDAGGLLASLYR
ncbi:MAG: hypothetical protein OEM24_00840 [Paracoccaceae bacterium]|nr:hypothetical protein [Paracoccaceae bacterium]